MEDIRRILPEAAISGWRLIISDKGRFWAIRRQSFPRGALRVGAEPTVDADTFEEVQAAVERQEEIARRAATVQGAAS
ncbi:hypothetical protein AB0395_04125 [Streptosporangium sp. NPDC051023]|uniref:hypothetical protein n=1 Tax=Streptosporangium sp. NPDC051023 TaxID=3155410 RepID=UPI00344F5C0F